MNFPVNIYAGLLFMLFVLSCTTGKNISGDIEEVCRVELGERYINESSPENTYVLCLQEVNAEQNRTLPTIKYIVIDAKTKKLVYRGTVLQGKIKWNTDKKLLIHEKIGILGQKNQNERIYIVNVEDGHITQINQNEKF